MLPNVAALASALLLTAPALAATHGLVLVSPSPAAGNGPARLTPAEARLLIASRLGLAQFHTLEGASGRSVDAINSHGIGSAWRSTQGTAPPPHAFLLIEGIDGVDESFVGKKSRPVLLEQTPSPASSEEFFASLNDQQRLLRAEAQGPAAGRTSTSVNDTLGDLQSWLSGGRTGGLMLHSTGFESLASKFGTASKEYKKALGELRALLGKVVGAEGAASTVVLLPREPAGGLFRRAPSTASWGQPAPAVARQLDSDRFDDDDRPDTLAGSYGGGSLDTDLPASAAQDDSDNGGGDNDTSPIVAPLGILPVCYKDLQACEDATHRCSGHGSCRLRNTVPDVEDPHCYACACEPTRERVGNGYQTTEWAGPACQKQDVTAPFWLLTSVAVGLVSAVVWGVGLLYSMGSEELPSVIGAGVAVGGSRAK